MTRLIIALLLLCTCTSATRFYLNGTFRCDSWDAPWCVTIEAVELDALSAAEVIATFKECFTAEQKEAVYELDGTQSDDGWFDAFFELGYNVVHTCRINDEPFHLIGTLQQFPVWKEFYHEEKIFDLNDNTIHHVHSLCDEEQYDCMVSKKKFYFLVSFYPKPKRASLRTIRMY
ncbi:unnamed protein product [Caenorhabditis nigoni]